MTAVHRVLDGLGLVVFDKDGTLIDFDAMWAGWAAELAARLEVALGRSVADPLYAAIGYDVATGRSTVHGPLAVMPMSALRSLTVEVVRASGLTSAAAQAAVATAWHAPDPLALAHPLADLRRLFATLGARGTRIAVATSDDRAPTQATLAGLGLGDLIDGIVCADDGLPVKPAADMVRYLCRSLRVPATATAMVGDSTADLAMGRAAGVARCVGVLSGVGSLEDLAPLADLVVDSVGDLLASS